MGDVADMMLDGTLCCRCGVYIGKTGGVPVACADCSDEEQPHDRPRPKKSMVVCRLCGKPCKKGQGISDHLRVVHGTDPRVKTEIPSVK